MCCSPDLHCLAHSPDATCHCTHNVKREIRDFIDHEAKLALIQDGKLHTLLHPRRGGARCPIDHRHETNCLVRSADLHYLVADHHFDDAGLNDVHAIPGIALFEHC